MLKIGDKVKMTKRGFKFYGNVNIAFDMMSVGGVMDSEHFTHAICSQFAIHGIGTVNKLNVNGTPLIRWDFSINGMKYHYSDYFEINDIRKLNFLDKLHLKLRKLLCC